jgi:cobalt transport protein ATP-binding subunit
VGVAGILLQDVTYVYPDGQEALRGVSLEIAAGEVLGLLGSNGAGKSTLLMHLNGLLRGSGTVEVGGTPVGERTLPLVRARVGYVFQNPDDQLFLATVYDDVAFGPRNQGLPPLEVEQRVEAALRRVGMWEAAQRPPHHLSIGQKKRVAMATVLSMDCDVLVLDEPTSGLDPRGRRVLADYLRQLPQTRIIATHDLEFAAELCDRVAVLNAGTLAALGAPAEVLSDAALMERTGLEVPHSLRFHAHGIPHQHAAGGARLSGEI